VKPNVDKGFLIDEDEPVEFMGQSEDQMKVSHRQEFQFSFFQPARFGQGLTLGAVAVSAGVIGRALKATGITLL
jgi:hypothetical protein